MTEPSPAVDVAKKVEERDTERIIILPGGVEARIVPVSAALVDEVTASVKDPDVPIVHDEERDRDIENPDDPAYIRELSDMSRKRGVAAIDAMVMFGVELTKGLPENDAWLKKLVYMSKRGLVDLSGYDLENDLDLEFLYKRYVAITPTVLSIITEMSGISGADIEAAEESFRGD